MSASRVGRCFECSLFSWQYDELLCAVRVDIDWQNHRFFAKRDPNHGRINQGLGAEVERGRGAGRNLGDGLGLGVAAGGVAVAVGVGAGCGTL